MGGTVRTFAYLISFFLAAIAISPQASALARQETVYGDYTVIEDSSTGLCGIRQSTSSGTQLIFFPSDEGRKFVVSIKNPNFEFASNRALVTFKIGGAAEDFEWEMDVNHAEGGVSTSLWSVAYAPLINAMKSGSTMTLYIDRRAVETISLTGSLRAFDRVFACSPDFKREFAVGLEEEATLAHGTQELEGIIDDMIAQRSRSWFINRYDMGSAHNLTYFDDRGDGAVRVRAEYTYNRGQYGWVLVEFYQDNSVCMRFWDFQNVCR